MVAEAVKDWQATIPDTGEAPEVPLEVHVGRLVAGVVGIAPSKTPGVNACKALGIDSSRYVEAEAGALGLNWTLADRATRHPGDARPKRRRKADGAADAA